MNWDRMAGDWKQVKDRVREQWGLLSDERLDRIAGKRDRLVGNIQESYGIAREDGGTPGDGVGNAQCLPRHRACPSADGPGRRWAEHRILNTTRSLKWEMAW